MHPLEPFFAVQQERADRASNAGENRERDERHQQSENHDQSESVRGVKEVDDLLKTGVAALSSVLLNVGHESIVNVFSGAEHSPERESDADNSEPQSPGQRSQACSHARSDIRSGTSPPVKHYREKPGSKHGEARRLAYHDDQSRYD